MRRSTRLTVAALLGILASMAVLTGYSVSLYRLFCAVTGAGGTTTRAARAPGAAGAPVTVRFDTATDRGLPWLFEPVGRAVSVTPGVETLAFFRARNESAEALVGHATFNVTPEKAAIYFKKIQCFCFSEERLGPGEQVDMPVTFFVDPAIAADPNTADVHEITLSYTFFPSRRPGDAQPLSRFGPPDASRGRVLFAADCSACHGLHDAKVGPPLAGVVGRVAGRAPGYAYSPALAGSGIRWTPALLETWLAGPSALVPGTRMAVQVEAATARRDIVAFLAQPASSLAASTAK